MTRFKLSIAANTNKALAAVIVAAMPCVVSAQTQPFLFSTVSASGGMWVLNNTNGHASFCQAVVAPGPGLAIGKCDAVGTAIGPAPYTLQGAGSALWVISKSGVISLCSSAPGPGTNRPLGCQQISTTASLP